jgi:hypothetical protein
MTLVNILGWAVIAIVIGGCCLVLALSRRDRYDDSEWDDGGNGPGGASGPPR